MAEQFLTLMADLDDASQHLLGGWYKKLQDAGFMGTQTPGLPFHISIASFSLEKEAEAVREMKELAVRFSAIPVHISHIGLFAGGRILYAAPDMNPADLLDLRKAVQTETQERFPWTPHCTILIDEAETIRKALPVLVEQFKPFMDRIGKVLLAIGGANLAIGLLNSFNPVARLGWVNLLVATLLMYALGRIHGKKEALEKERELHE